jgi:hypothetical protein
VIEKRQGRNADFEAIDPLFLMITLIQTTNENIVYDHEADPMLSPKKPNKDPHAPSAGRCPQ